MWEERLQLYDDIIAQCPQLERKGKTMPYTSANGHMFSLLNKAGEIGIRFSKETQQKYLEEFNTSLFKSYGATMRGYILIPESLLAHPEKVAALMKESYAYVLSLEPGNTKKK